MQNVQELEIIYNDEHIVVANKPGGLLAVPGRGPDKQDCLTRRLRARFPKMIVQPAVHRLDMCTSGLMVCAIDKASHRNLCSQFMQRRVKKRYLAVLEGTTTETKGEINLALRLDPDNRPLQVHDPIQGKEGITRWRKLAEKAGRTLVEFTPITGRTHQLRLHSAHAQGLGMPIVGDSLYGRGKDGEPMLLHAFSICFDHPSTGKLCRFTVQPPHHWNTILGACPLLFQPDTSAF
ncbi:MAG: RNA pseudouridine synthase [Deltaproteobacteria bacterium]|nr:MAG: RNA pseudouridine synthase [Deltaproteobacteria bacterium]